MSQSKQTEGRTHIGMFRSLLRDTTANTLAISAAAMVPLVAMVGGGIDASRYYMAQSRLQAACDAGALAGRRAMETTNFTESQTENQNDPTPQDIADNFFNENYPDGTFGMENLTHSYSADSGGEVTGLASGNMPTTLMGMFGYDEVELSVTCSADVNIANTDIVFVLDVTGSMQCPAGQSCSQSFPGPGSTVASTSKLADLQVAAKDFFDVVDSASSAQAQIRYGFVPYTSQVNIGKLIYAENPAYMASAGDYQSRLAQFDEDWKEVDRTRDSNYTNLGEEEDPWFFTSAQGNVSESFCDSYTQANFSTIDTFEVNGSTDYANATQVNQVVTGTYRITTYEGTQVTLRRAEPAYRYDSGSSPTCRVGYDVYDRTAEVGLTIEEEVERTFTGYLYDERNFPLTDLYDDDSMDTDLGTQGGNKTVTWNGCIEEVKTDEGQTDFTTVADTAYDLDINHIPTSDNDTRWKPSVPGLVFYRYDDGQSFSSNNSTYWELNPMTTKTEKFSASDWSNSLYYTCPTEAQGLQELDETQFDSYIDDLRAWGYTYLDTGMIWGARMISPEGIFSSTNTFSKNGAAISRHIVFMTDGTQSSRRAVYGMYGIEWWDRRIATDGVEETIETNHEARLLAACRAARNQNISVWVVAFGTTLTSLLTDCATPGRAYQADNREQLKDRFSEIAEKIAELRLTK